MASARAVKQEAIGAQTVAASTANLLVIALQVLGQVVVKDKPHIRFVDAQAKGDGRDDQRHLIVDEPLLVLGAQPVIQSRRGRAAPASPWRSAAALSSSTSLRLPQ